MAYVVKIAARAERDLALLFEAINAEESDTALTWYKGLKRAILSLGEMPDRCPITRGKDQLRQLLYGRRPHVYRAIFRVFERRKQVEALHIRHGARRDFKASHLK
jgi:plasmid stabilization system protein ParE